MLIMVLNANIANNAVNTANVSVAVNSIDADNNKGAMVPWFWRGFCSYSVIDAIIYKRNCLWIVKITLESIVCESDLLSVKLT